MRNSLIKKNVIAVGIIIITFILMFITTLLLEFQLFKNPLRYMLVCLLVLIELYWGFLIIKNYIKLN